LKEIKKETFTLLTGGSAGNGVKKVGSVASYIFSNWGRYVFEMEDYQSLIKGGHNFCSVSTSLNPILSHYHKADLIVALDDKSYNKHKGELADDGVLVYDSDTVKSSESSHIGVPLTTFAKQYPNAELRIGVGAIAALASVTNIPKDELDKVIIDQYRDAENNVKFAYEVYDYLEQNLEHKFAIDKSQSRKIVLSGNEAIALGGVAGGLDLFLAYPMTPASSILHFLAAHSDEFNLAVVHPESELAVINMAIGASSVGLKTMVASSGGGFALMEEALSLAGMTEVPVLAVLSSRPGPSTGVPTYTEQGDLYFAINQGHGEFPRIVASPATHEEAFYLTAELLSLAWEFQTVAILLTEKHLSESRKTFEIDFSKVKFAEYLKHVDGKYQRYKITDNGISPLLFPPTDEVVKFSSYEHDEYGLSTEDPEMISKMHEKRFRKEQTLKMKLKTVNTVNVFSSGNSDKTSPVVFTYGSTTMSVLEALKYANIPATVVQPIYLEPFPEWELQKYSGRKAVVVEQSTRGSFEQLLKEKAQIIVDNHIRKYDGRPFEVEELAAKLREVLK
jgi:2-oxoglutarate ferredoxin oxidoreductase subunit alpha